MTTEYAVRDQGLLSRPEPVLAAALERGIALDSLPGNTAKIRLILDLARQVAAADAPLRILDVGAGGKFNPFNLWEPFVPYRESIALSGVDVAHLEATAARAAELGFPVELRHGSADAVGEVFEEGTFDAVVSTQVLEHLPNWRAGLAAMARLLRPGGMLYVTCDSGDLERPITERARLGAKRAYARLAERAPRLRLSTGLSGDWESAPTRTQVADAAQRSGLEIEALRHYGFGQLKVAATRLDVQGRLMLLALEERLAGADEGTFRLLYLRARRRPG